MRKQKWRKETSPPFSPLFQTKLDPSQISPTDRTDHPFLPSSILLHLLGATPTSNVATSEISFERTSRDARTKRYSNISTLSLPPDDTIFQFWFTTQSSSSYGIASTRDKNYRIRTITRARGWLVRDLGSRQREEPRSLTKKNWHARNSRRGETGYPTITREKFSTLKRSPPPSSVPSRDISTTNSQPRTFNPTLFAELCSAISTRQFNAIRRHRRRQKVDSLLALVILDEGEEREREGEN